MASHVKRLACASCLLLLAACVQTSVDDAGVEQFSYQLWLPFLILVVGLATVPAAWLFRSHLSWFAWPIALVGPAVAFLFAPMLYLEQVSVSDRGFDVRSGIWGKSAALTVKFDQVKVIRIGEEETGGRASRVIAVLLFDGPRGTTERFSLNNDVKIASSHSILDRAAARGIPVFRNK